MRLRTSGSIITPAIYGVFGRSPLLRTGQRTRGGSIISPPLFSSIFFHFSIIFLGRAHILGTLRQMGEGNLNFLIVFLSFIPGMALVVYIINPLLEKGYNVQKLLLPGLLHVAAPYVTGILSLGAIILLWKIRLRKQ